MFSAVLISVGVVLVLAMAIPNVFGQAYLPLIQRLIRASPELVEPCGDNLSDCLIVIYESPTRVVMYGEYFIFSFGFKDVHNQAIWKAVDLLESEGFTMKDMELDLSLILLWYPSVFTFYLVFRDCLYSTLLHLHRLVC